MLREFKAQFEKDPDRAVSQVVDAMLASPQFGERWGRHWLDVARFAESSGKETNATFPYAWRYRNWVIDAFNQNKPFDEMITEQLAGDLLEKENGEPAGDQTIATGFLAIGVKGLNERNTRQFRFDVADEQIDTTTRAFLATSVACARCHDHKFDPVPMSDYYAMAGIFLSSHTFYGTAGAIQNQHATELVSLPAKYASGAKSRPLGEMIDLEFQLATIRERRDELLTEIRDARRSGDNEKAIRLRGGLLGLNNQVAIRRSRLAAYDDDGNPIPKAMGMSDRAEPFDSQILIRGEEDNATKERVPADSPASLKPATNNTFPPIKAVASRWRVGSLPRKIRSPRVFSRTGPGSGCLAKESFSTVDNFGSTGEKPSHPELLDYLAIRFVELDWSVKDLVKEIVTSRTYRMSSDFRKDHFEKTPTTVFTGEPTSVVSMRNLSATRFSRRAANSISIARRFHHFPNRNRIYRKNGQRKPAQSSREISIGLPAHCPGSGSRFSESFRFCRSQFDGRETRSHDRSLPGALPDELGFCRRERSADARFLWKI